MTEKELRKLNRAELLEMLIMQMKQNEALRIELDLTKDKLNSRQIKIDKAGSIAEAALQINAVFEAADAAAKQYLENVRNAVSDEKELCRQMQEKTKQKCDDMIRECEKKCAQREQAMEKRHQELILLLQQFYDEHPGLREAVQNLQKGEA